MTATLDSTRYTDRKQHDCGCVTVWDTCGGGARYITACGVHRRYAQHWSAPDGR